MFHSVRRGEVDVRGSALRRVGCVGALVGALTPLFVASPALATVHHPTGIFAPFSDCALSDPAVALCLVARLTDGELTIGSRTVPIDRSVTLQTGLVEEEENDRMYTFAGAEDGQTLHKTFLNIPGGLAGIERVTRTTEVTLTPELVGPIGAAEFNEYNLGSEQGPGLTLPIRAKLNNPLLGGNCYVGSASHPLLLTLTDGTTSPPLPNEPIKGVFGEPVTIKEPNGGAGYRRMLRDVGSWVVNNTFAAPVATGCGVLDSALIDADLGLPSPAGHNTAILGGELELATPDAIEESE
jgi:hypothetical protein